MNFLAHSLLGFDDSALIAGQFCGDFVRGRDLSHLPEQVARGIRLHRHLDVYTDSFPGLLSARQEMTGVPRRFVGIIVDVLLDHHLAAHWGQYSDLALSEHAGKIQCSLKEHEGVFPDSLKKFMVALEKHAILENNLHLTSIELTLERLSRRSPRFAALAVGQEKLIPWRDLLESRFEEFYPSLEQAALTYLSEHPARGD
ncbi:MAG: acyl carrier protein phosphodiesterase [Granulosicoccus sp.]|jgi:acyl carrier protein phosphodiesterase